MDVLKSFVSIIEKARDDEGYIITASTGDIDRHGEIVDVAGIDVERFKESPRILANHESTVENIIGRAIPESIKKVGGKLQMKIQFASDISPLAKTVEALVKGGYLNTLSIGFISKSAEVKRVKGNDVLVHTTSELLEVSLVAIPANPNAIINPVAKGICSKEDFRSFQKSTMTEEDLKSDILKKVDVLSEIHEDKKHLTKFFANIAKTVGYQAVGDFEIDTKNLSEIVEKCLIGYAPNDHAYIDDRKENPDIIKRFEIIKELHKINTNHK